MVASYFSKGKGRTGPVEYVLDKERVKSGEAKLLRGDAQVTAELIKTNNNELKYRSGVLSFTEKDLDHTTKQQIMDEFERSTFAGMQKEQYNILWVEHQDKDRLELHFVIPRLELTTGKAFNPHWHKADQDRLLLFQDIQNAKFNLTNPYEEERANTLQIPTKWDNRSKVKEEINDVIIQGVSTGQLQNREQIVEFLESNDLEVKRSKKGKLPKDYIAVKSPEDEKYIRLKGVYYNENFTSAAEVERQLTAREREHSLTTPEQLREAEQRLEKAISKRAKYNNERYKKAEQIQSKSNDININSNTNNRVINRNDDSRLYTEISKPNQVASTKKDEIRREREQVHQEPKNLLESRQENNIYQDRGIDENRTRATTRTTATEERERAYRELQQRERAYEEARESRIKLHKANQGHTRELLERAREYQRKQQAEQQTNIQESEAITRTAHRATESVSKITRAINTIRGYKDKCVNYIKDAREYLKDKYNEYIRGYNQLPYKLQETTDIIQATTKEIKPELSFNDVEKFRVSLNNSVNYSNFQVELEQSQSQKQGYSMSM